jgi:integrase
LKRSTKTKDRRQAQKIANEFEAAAMRARTAKQTRAVIVSLHKDLTGDAMAFPTVREQVRAWLERKRPETAASTLAFYTKSTSSFLEYLGSEADKPIDGLTVAHVAGFRNHRANLVSPKTASHDLKAIKMLLLSAKKDGLLIDNPGEHVDTIRQRVGSKVERRPFTMAELVAVLEAAEDEWKSMILFGLYTGARLSDVASLTWDNIDTVRDELRFVARKTSRVTILPLAGPLADHVASLPAPDKAGAPVHPAAFGVLERTGRSGGLSTQFGDLLASCGLRERISRKSTGKGLDTEREGKGLSFHCLRHTAVSWLKDKGIPASVVQEMVGHSSQAMNKLYTHSGTDALTLAAEAMPSLEKMGVAQ